MNAMGSSTDGLFLYLKGENMTQSDYIEKHLGIKLLDCQKNMINELEKSQRSQKIYLIYPPRLGRTYLKQLYESMKNIFDDEHNRKEKTNESL